LASNAKTAGGRVHCLEELPCDDLVEVSVQIPVRASSRQARMSTQALRIELGRASANLSREAYHHRVEGILTVCEAWLQPPAVNVVLHEEAINRQITTLGKALNASAREPQDARIPDQIAD